MNILVVDDAKAIQHIMCSMLRDFGYKNLYTASNLEEAKNVLKAKPIDLIFSDLHMPNGSGFELLKQVRSTMETAKIPFIVITGDQDKKNVIEAVKLGIQSYLMKPMQKQVLYQKLNELIKSNTIPAPDKNEPIQSQIV